MKSDQSALRPSRTSMHSRKALFCAIALMVGAFVCQMVVAAAQPKSIRVTPGQQIAMPQRALIIQRVARLKQARDEFRSIAAAPLPRDLSSEQQAEARRYVAWLQASSSTMDALAAKGEAAIGAGGGGGQDQLFSATKDMQESQMSFNLQYLQLQSQMQHENRSYTAVSNIMKTKHDTVKNSIGNIR